MQQFLFSLLVALLPALLTAQQPASTTDSPSGAAATQAPRILSVTTTAEACGAGNGAIQIYATGENGALQYSVDGNSFQMSNHFRDLRSGQYNVAVMDVSGRISIQPVYLPSTERIQLSYISTTPSVCTDNTGSIKVLLADESKAYVFSLNGGIPQTDPEFTTLASGTYALHIADEEGCSIDTTITIDQEACPLYIPNIFSPNGDGVNDLFRLQAPGDQNIMITRFYIFDNWGNNVFEKFNLPIHSETGWWDGTYKRFTANPGIFAYYVEVQFENGQRETYKGKITLIR